jgi:hypothetical protein
MREFLPKHEMLYGGPFGGPMYLDEHGEPVTRTPKTHPYTYDGFVIWSIDDEEPNDTIYTDRLTMWDHAKHDRLCEKHFGNDHQYWDKRAPKKIEAFLKDWIEDPNLQLIRVIQYCNQSSGYPTWRLDYFVPGRYEKSS